MKQLQGGGRRALHQEAQGEGERLTKMMGQSLELATGRILPVRTGPISSGLLGDVRWGDQARAKGRVKSGVRPGQSLPPIAEGARLEERPLPGRNNLYSEAGRMCQAKWGRSSGRSIPEGKR